MTIISRHPYSFLFAGAGVVLLAIVLFAQNRSAPFVPGGTEGPSANTSFTPVSADGTLVSVGISNPQLPVPSGPANPSTQLTPVNLPLPFVPTGAGAVAPAPAPQNSVQGTSFASNVSSTASSPLSESDAMLKEVYSLVSSGLQTLPSAPQRTPAQQALFAYGNEAGLAILTFENAHVDMADVLKQWLAGRTNSSNTAAVTALADGLIQAGASLEALPDVPPAAASANAALAESLKDAGNKLKGVAAAGNDDTALAAAIKTYDAAADTFTRNYVAVMDLFSLYGVSFSGADAGSVFQFSSAGGL